MEKEEYTLIPQCIWEKELSMEERYMMLFLLDCENHFNKKNDWFSLNDEDFIDIGFGKNKVVLRRTRNSLIDKGILEFKKGSFDKKSQYKLTHKMNGKKVPNIKK